MNRSRKNRHSYAALTLACSLALAGGGVLTGCSSASTSASKVTTESSDESSTETSAAVSSSDESSSAGETAASGSGSTAESGESGSAAENSGNAPSGQAPGNGQAPANGETPPELPSGESGSAPSGQAPGNGQAPANGETPHEKPSSDTSGNTSGNVYLSGTTLDFDSDKVNLMTIAGNNDNNWGTAGSNGGTVTLTADGETLSGNISVDTISSLDFYLLNGTTYTGAMKITDNADTSDASAAPITVNVSSDSTCLETMPLMSRL